MSEENNTMDLPPEEEQPTGRTLLRGRIISGQPLPVAAQKRIVQRFEALLGCHVRLSYRVDKALIAGIRVEVDGRAYDGSLSGQLTQARKLLMRHDEEEL